MAATILPQNCEPGQKRRIVCHDMTDWPSTPPVSIYAHAACISSRGFEGVSVLTSVADPGRIIQPQLALA